MNTIEQNMGIERKDIAQSREAIARFLNPQRYAQQDATSKVPVLEDRVQQAYDKEQESPHASAPMFAMAQSLFDSLVSTHPLAQQAKSLHPAASSVVRRYPVPTLALAGLAGAAMIYNPALRKRAAALLVTSAAAGGLALKPLLGRVTGELIKQFGKR